MFCRSLALLASLMVVIVLLVHQNECRPTLKDDPTTSSYNKEDENIDSNINQPESSSPSSQSEDGLTQQDLLDNGMNLDETQAIPVLIEVPDSEPPDSAVPNDNYNNDSNGTNDHQHKNIHRKNDRAQSSSDSDTNESEMAPAESANTERYERRQNGVPIGDLKPSASHHYHGHGAKGWLDMGAWTGKKGAFGWYDKHPVGKGK